MDADLGHRGTFHVRTRLAVMEHAMVLLREGCSSRLYEQPSHRGMVPRGCLCLFQNGDASTAVSMFRTDQKLRIFDPSQFSYLFLPLVWPHGIIGHLGETFGSFTAFAALTLESHPTKSRL
jgi:hypothetical protein